MILSFEYGTYEYDESCGYDDLPGAVIDMYIANKYLPLSVKVTDAKKRRSEYYMDSILEGIVDADIIHFDWDPEKYSRKKILDLIEKEQPTIVYFSGHCENNYLICPTGEKIHLTEIEDLLPMGCLFILDCCLVNISARCDGSRFSYIYSKTIRPLSTNKGSLFTQNVFPQIVAPYLARQPCGNTFDCHVKNIDYIK
jgi:hypothetical protein